MSESTAEMERKAFLRKKLFYRDSYITEFEAKVTACREKNGKYEIELDRTAFFPEGGGQYADKGVLEGVRVSDVQEENGVILHITDQPLETGSTVRGRIDWEERFMKMQQHTGEHIVSGLVNSHFGYKNVGFHLGHEDCTMDFEGAISGEELSLIEREANGAVWKNIRVRTLYPSDEELAKMEYRSKIEIEGQVRIVEIPGYDRCACCAPHVARTGEIGMIKLTNVQRYKGGVRVTMLCGIRALHDYVMKQDQIKNICGRLCAREYEADAAVERLGEEYTSLKYKLVEKERMMADYIAASVPAGQEAVCLFPEGLEEESVRKLMNRVLEDGHRMCAVFRETQKDTYRYVFGSRAEDMKEFASAFHEYFGGRGGGRPEMVQGTVSGFREEIREWVLRKAGSGK